MDDLDARIIMVLADSTSPITAYEVTSKLYPDDRKEAVRAMRPKIRNRLTNIIRELDILETKKSKGGVGYYALRAGAHVSKHCILQVPDIEQAFDVGDALVVPSEDLVVVLNSWV